MAGLALCMMAALISGAGLMLAINNRSSIVPSGTLLAVALIMIIANVVEQWQNHRKSQKLVIEVETKITVDNDS